MTIGTCRHPPRPPSSAFPALAVLFALCVGPVLAAEERVGWAPAPKTLAPGPRRGGVGPLSPTIAGTAASPTARIRLERLLAERLRARASGATPPWAGSSRNTVQSARPVEGPAAPPPAAAPIAAGKPAPTVPAKAAGPGGDVRAPIPGRRTTAPRIAAPAQATPPGRPPKLSPPAPVGEVAEARSPLVRPPAGATRRVGPAPDRPVLPATSGEIDRIIAFQEEGDFDQAIGEAHRLVERGGAFPLRFFLAELLQRAGRHGEARAVFRDILAAGSPADTPAALFGIAQTSLALGDEQQAMRCCTDLVRRAPAAAPVIEFARFMRTAAPASIEARLADFLDLAANRARGPAPRRN